METVILCGGKGTRLGEFGERDPKPLLPIGPKPIIWHIMKTYAAYGHREFTLCLGHLGDRFHEHAEEWRAEWNVDLAETGLDTPTGGRILRVADRVRGGEFFGTYGDGVADIDLDALLAFHRGHGRVATLTVVRPQLQFGVVELDADGRVGAFAEKPPAEHWVNGGFFVFQRAVFDYLAEDAVLERGPFERLAAEGELMGYRHDGFWSCMDTYKDNVFLNECWQKGEARWKVWDDE